MNRFDNKVAVITGGNSGIGVATARLLLSEGARVAITGRDDATVHAAARDLDVLAIRADVANLADIDQAYREIGAQLGKIDVLFANAVAFLASTEAVCIVGAELAVDGGLAQL